MNGIISKLVVSSCDFYLYHFISEIMFNGLHGILPNLCLIYKYLPPTAILKEGIFMISKEYL